MLKEKINIKHFSGLKSANIKLVIKKRSQDFVVFVKNHPNIQALGDTVITAISNFGQNHPKVISIDYEWSTDQYTTMFRQGDLAIAI